MSTPTRLRSAAMLLFVVAIATTFVIGCGDGQTTWLMKKQSPETAAEQASLDDDPREDSAGVRDTVQTVAWLEGLRRMSIGGYGLVVGLGKNGTSQCPRPVREIMLQDLRRRYRKGGAYGLVSKVSPERLLDSEETAVVLVYGEIPAAAHKDTQIDLKVRALEGTDVRSLEGGYLMPCHLKLWAGMRPVEGRILGEGSGQVFINPFGLKEDAATKANPREGLVVGGGRTLKDRRIRLVLTNPSAAVASRLMYLINRRFGVEPKKTADAMNPNVVNLRVPPRWEGKEPHFLQLLTHLYVPASPSFHDLRLRELSEEALQPEAALADISLAWEGLGKSSLPSVRTLYTHRDHGVSYFAGRAGLRLGDDLAIKVMARHAGNADSPFRELAIEELGAATDLSRAALVLRPLLDNSNHRVRQLAYEGLRRHGDPLIRRFKVGEQGGFVVDVVPSAGGNLITARRSGEQCIALFGRQMGCQTPVFYWHRNETAVITAKAGQAELSLVRRTPITHRLTPAMTCPTDLPRLILALGQEPRKLSDGSYWGLGLTYSQVVEVLHDLCAEKTIDAAFVLQGPSAAEISLPQSGAERPESEL